MGCVAVVGLGLMGGSLARELAAAGERVLGHDRDAEAVEAACAGGVLAGALGAGLEGVAEADLLVVAVPVSAAPAVLEAARAHLRPDAVVTDLGSTKQGVVRAAAALGLGARFVGSHPLAGDHRSGWGASRPGLYRGARVYLTPTPETAPEALARVTALWTSLGAETRALEAAEHDRLLAWSSHLPQVVATATAGALAAASVPRAELGPGGRDVTRLAASSAEMWSAVSLENADFLAAAVAALEDRLARFRAALEARDEAALRRAFLDAAGWAREPAGRG